jgi:hypothetical protein
MHVASKATKFIGSAVRVVAACLGSLVVLNVLFIVLLTLALLIPSNSRIEKHLADAFQTEVAASSGYGGGYKGGLAYDTYSECLALGVNLTDTDKSIFYRVIAGPVVQFATEEVRRFRMIQTGSEAVRYHNAPCPALIARLQGTAPTFGMSLFRFWQGHQVYTRTLLSMMSLESMHRVTAILLFASFVLLGFRLAAMFGGWAWAVLVVPFALIGDLLSMPLSTTHALQTGWFFLSTALVAVILKRDRHLTGLLVFVFASGALTNFVSYLYNPPLGAGLMSFMVIAMRLSSKSPERNRLALTDGILATGAWFAGFGLAWISKWALAIAVLGYQVVLPDLQAASSGRAYGVAMRVGRLYPLHTSWKVSRNGVDHLQIMLVIFGAIAIAILLRYALAGRLTREAIVGFCIMQLPALLQIVWVEGVMRNHSLEHLWAYRNFLLLGICPLLGAMLVARQSQSPLHRAVGQD